jgi:hypothetical protein
MYGYSYVPGGAVHAHHGPATWVFDFTTNILPSGFAVARATPAARFNAAGNLEVLAANTPRLSRLPGRGTTGAGLLVEAATTNLLGHTVVTTADTSSSGASLSDLSLGALGILPGVGIASTGADWNRALRNVTLTAGQTYAARLFLRPASATTLMVMFKNGATSQSSQVQGTIGALASVNPQAGALSIIRQDVLKDGLTWAIDLVFVPTLAATYSVGVGPFTSMSGASITLLAWQLEQDAASSSLVIDGTGSSTRSAETVSTPMDAGLYDIDAAFADGTTQSLVAQSLAAGQWPSLSNHHVARLTYVAA